MTQSYLQAIILVSKPNIIEMFVRQSVSNANLLAGFPSVSLPSYLQLGSRPAAAAGLSTGPHQQPSIPPSLLRITQGEKTKVTIHFSSL